MGSWWTWLFDLDRIDLATSGRYSVQLLRPLEGWMWLVAGVGVAIYVTVIYREDGGSRLARTLLATLRGLLLLLVLLLICEPAIMQHRDRIEPSTLAIVLDSSASMNRHDPYNAEEWARLQKLWTVPRTSTNTTRWDIAQSVLQQGQHDWLQQLAQQHELRWFELAGSVSSPQRFSDASAIQHQLERLRDREATGASTLLATGLQKVLNSCLDAHLSGIVLLSDGQPTQNEDWRGLIEQARIRGTPIYTVPIGSERIPIDLAVRRARADSHVYLGDQVRVSVEVSDSGLPPGSTFDLLLTGGESSDLLAKQTVTAMGGPQGVELVFEPKAAGDWPLAVEIPAQPGELETNNNRVQLPLRVVDEQVRVLYVDGYPRYEFRYLRSVLLREKSMLSSTLLLSADEQFPQEGSLPIRRFPRDAEELNSYDVILLGDVDPRGAWLTPSQWEMLADFVTRQGGGLAFIAGSTYTPLVWKGTPLERLVPVELEPERNETTLLTSTDLAPGFGVRLARSGQDHPLIRLTQGSSTTDLPVLLQQLPRWYWYYHCGRARPGTEVLLVPDTATGDQPIAEDQLTPLVVVGRHGRGLTLYQGSDDVWRWRRYQGEGFYDQYWLQAIRYLARNKKFAQPGAILLRSDQSRYEPQQPIILTLEMTDAAVAATLPEAVQVELRNTHGQRLENVTLHQLGKSGQYYEGLAETDALGQIEAVFNPAAYGLSDSEVRTRFDIETQTLENRRPAADPHRLEELALATGGVSLNPAAADQLAQHIEPRQYIIADDVSETIWDSRLSLILFSLLIVAEWIGRKKCGLT
ncbi:MAG: hypothetical protein HJJLKODD_01777 [Phycisphaerae bacterium]|nr:hypothetical protein [Phycisphaerae bacterium]